MVHVGAPWREKERPTALHLTDLAIGLGRRVNRIGSRLHRAPVTASLSIFVVC
jgi:hypothetical protein